MLEKSAFYVNYRVWFIGPISVIYLSHTKSMQKHDQECQAWQFADDHLSKQQ